MRNIMCFDVGGTYIKYGIVREDGIILFRHKVHTPKINCKETIPEQMAKLFNSLKSIYNISAIGVSTAGKVDTKKGEIIFATDNIPNYTGAKISERMKEATGLECFVENDVNAAALGEMWQGAGQGREDFICLTLGTGIGGALILNGRLYKGFSEGAGWIGHMIVERNGEECTCGFKGCYERYASTSALIRNYAKRSGESIEGLSGEEIMNRVKYGDKIAIEVYEEFIDYIAIGLTNLVNIIDPGLIIIGGGISSQGEFFFQSIRKRFKELTLPIYGQNTEILQAKLKNDAGILGACYIVLNSMV